MSDEKASSGVNSAMLASMSQHSTSSTEMLRTGDGASSKEILPQVLTPHKISVLGAEGKSLDDLLNNGGITLFTSGNSAFEIDLNNVSSLMQVQMAHKAVIEELNSLGDTQLSNTGIAKQVNANLPSLKSQGGQEH